MAVVVRETLGVIVPPIVTFAPEKVIAAEEPPFITASVSKVSSPTISIPVAIVANRVVLSCRNDTAPSSVAIIAISPLANFI